MSVSRVSICFLMQNLKVGGAEKVGVTIIKHLDRRKFFPSLLVLGDDKGQLRRSLPQCLNVIYLSKRRAIFSLPRLIENIWSQKPDILFVNLSHLNLLLAMFRWLLPRNTLVIARETSVVSLNNVGYRFSLFGTCFTGFFIDILTI